MWAASRRSHPVGVRPYGVRHSCPYRLWDVVSSAGQHHERGAGDTFAATLAYMECALGLFHAGGVPRAAQLETVGLFNGVVTALATASVRQTPTAPDQDLVDLLTTGHYPHFAAVAGRALPEPLDLEREFGRLGRVW